MTPEIREQARLTLLRYLDAAADASPGRGVPTAVLMQHLRAEGFGPIDRPGTLALLQYLSGKGFVEMTTKGVSPEVADWRITSAGRDEYARVSA